MTVLLYGLSEILCMGPAAPLNGHTTLSSQLLGVGTTATYSCDPGYVLVGETTRTCEDVNGNVIGTWNGTMPTCEGRNFTPIFATRITYANHAVIIRCQPLTQPSNGGVTISSGTHGVTLGRGATATYSCDTGYGLVGQATRTCVVTNGGTTGTWSGSQPTCQGEWFN